MAKYEVPRCPRHLVDLVPGPQELIEDGAGERWVTYVDSCPEAGCEHQHASPWRAPTAKQLKAWAWLKTQGHVTTVAHTARDMGFAADPPEDTAIRSRSAVLLELRRAGATEAELLEALAELEKLPAD